MKKIFLIISLLTGSIVNSQKLLPLEEAIATALQHNYDILLSKNDSAIAAIDYSYRDAVFIPRLNANAGTVWNNNNTKQTLSDGTERNRTGLKSNNINSQLALSWTLFDGLKMFITRDKQAQLVELGELVIKNQVVNTIAAVINNYYNIVQQKQQLKAIQEQISIDTERVKLAQYRLDVGVGIKPDLLQSKIDLNVQKAAQLLQEALIAQLREELNRNMGVPQFTVYEVDDSIPINHGIVLDETLREAEKNNTALLMAKKNIDIAGFTLRERKAERFPTVSFNSAYNFNQTTNQAVINNFSTLFNQNRGFNYGFTASIPILNNFNTRRLIRQAQWDIDYQSLVYENERSVTALNVIKAYQAYELLKKALELEEENIIWANENLDIVLQTYRLNSATLLELKLAQNTQADAYRRLIGARYNTKVAETELLRLKGELVR